MVTATTMPCSGSVRSEVKPPTEAPLCPNTVVVFASGPSGSGWDKPAETVPRRFAGRELERGSQHIDRLGAQEASIERREAEPDDVGRR